MTERFGLEPLRWRSRWREALDACVRLGGEARSLRIGSAASEPDIAHAEREVGVALPPAFRRVLVEFSAEVSFSWFLPEDHDLPGPFHGIFGGGCSWSLARLPAIQKSVIGWVSEIFPNQNSTYDRVWHDKLGFHEVGNGDFLALDLAPESAGAVVYLSHDSGAGQPPPPAE